MVHAKNGKEPAVIGGISPKSTILDVKNKALNPKYHTGWTRFKRASSNANISKSI